MLPQMPVVQSSRMQLHLHDDSFVSTVSTEFDFCEQIPSDKTCSVDIEESLLRGVSLNTVMHGFCQAFSKKQGTVRDYAKSQKASHIDDFVSHDWGSARLWKAATLYYHYNGLYAIVASIAAGVITAALQLDEIAVLPKPPLKQIFVSGRTWQAGYGIWCVYICPVVFMITVLNFHKLLAMFHSRHRLLFIDKFCIDQVDAERKRAGILGLAGFLKNSTELVICWTPRYLTRLWCVYEIASWKYLGKSLKEVTLIPSSQVTLVFGVKASLGMYYILFRSLSLYVDGWVINIVSLPIILSALYYPTGRVLQTLAVLPHQLESFVVKDCECFCCACNHVNPETGDAGEAGESMQCDRKLIYATLVQWFASSIQAEDTVDEQTLQEKALKKFDDFVRTEFAPWVLHNRGPTKIPYSQLFMAFIPVCWAACDCLPCYRSLPHLIFFRLVVCEYAVFWCLLLPSVGKVLLHMHAWLSRGADSVALPCSQWLINVLYYLLTMVGYAGTWKVLVTCNQFESILPILTFDSALLLLTLVLFGGSFELSSTSSTSNQQNVVTMCKAHSEEVLRHQHR